MAEHAPEPWPMGTYTTSSWGTARKFPPVGAHAAQQVGVKAGHHVSATLLCQVHGVLARFLKIVAVLDERDAQRAHGGVLLHRVATRHNDGAGHAVARAAQPMLWPWLPRVALITSWGSAPRAARAGQSRSGRRGS